jgi:hypothetical protein
MLGTTTAQDEGTAIVGASTLSDALGVLTSLHDYSVVGDTAYGGATYVFGDIYDNPLAIFRAEISQAAADDDVGTSTSSGTTMTDANLNTGAVVGQAWLYCTATVSDACNGELHFITEDEATDDQFTQMTAWSTALDGTESLILIPRVGALNVNLNSAATMLSSSQMASAGWAATWQMRVIRTWIRNTGREMEVLDPTTHNGLTGLNGLDVKFYADVIFSDHFANPESA